MTDRCRLWLVLLPAMAVPFVAALFYFVIFSHYAFAKIIYALAKAFLLIWPILSIRLILGGRFPRIDLGCPTHRRAIPLGAVIGITIVLLMFGLMKTPLASMVIDSSQQIRQKARQLGVLEHYWLFAVFLSIVHSFIEEYYWRWFVYGQLRQICGINVAAVLAAAAFAAHHVVIAAQFFPALWALAAGGTVALGGLIWCWMYQRQKTLVGAWLSHAIVDFGIMSIGYRVLSQ